MKILVLNGSPRVNGNTAAMTEAFKEGAESAGHSVSIINVGRMKISGCLACEYCHTKGNGVCTQKDDMQKIYPALAEADMIVFASPIYYFTLSAQLQSAIHRFYCIGQPQKMTKTAMLLSSESPNVYSGAVGQYKDMTDYFGVKDCGIITAYGAENKSEKKLSEVRKFASGL